MEPIQVPARALVYATDGFPFVEITLPEPAKTFWDDVCKAFRGTCQSHQNYMLPVDNGGVNGRTNGGQEIVINNLGKWLFGCPGYKGHVQYHPVSAQVFRVWYPSDAPQQVAEMLKSITGEQVKKSCRWWGDRNYELNWMCNESSL